MVLGASAAPNCELVASIIRLTLAPRLRHLAKIAGWRILLPLLRARAWRRRGALRSECVTVVTVNWNSREHLAVLIGTVRLRSPADTQILVVDNGSRNGRRDPLITRPDVRSVCLPVNMGHDLALDVGVLLCDTEYVVALDVDAFPLHDRWLEELLGPLRSGARISGARLNREYVHPCCWAMRTERFVSQGHSFRSRYQGRGPGQDASGDVGEEISRREAPRLHFMEVTSQRGPGDVGTVFGGAVYHNFYATRFRATTKQTLDRGVGVDDAQRAWEEAVGRYAG